MTDRIITVDGLDVYARDWPALGGESPDARGACLLIVHGLGEHCKRYDSFVRALQAALPEMPLTARSFDLPGHGDTLKTNEHAGRRAVKGDFAFPAIDAILTHLLHDMAQPAILV